MSNKITIARPYAKAAFELALQEKKLVAWQALLRMAGFILQDQRVQELLQNPRLTSEQQYQWLVESCRSTLFVDGENLFKLLASRRRLSILPEIAQLFTDYCIEYDKKLTVQVKAALPLTAIQQQRLIKTLEQRLHRTITLDCQVDSTLLGGMVIRADDLVFDVSVRSKLQRLEQALID